MSHRKAIRELRRVGSITEARKESREDGAKTTKSQRGRSPRKCRIRDAEDVLWVARLKKKPEMLAGIQTLGKTAGVGGDGKPS